MAKKGGKRKKHQGGNAGHGPYGAQDAGMPYGAPDASAWGAHAPGMGANFQAGMAAGLGAPGSMPGLMPGVIQQLPAFLRTGSSEQFLIGALVGAAAAWVLSDEELRGKIIKSAMKVYASAAGGFEEMKEQMADLKAEVEAERHGEA